MLFCGKTFADVPATLNFQGRLTDTAGNPVNGNRNFRFEIWNASTGGTRVWQSGAGNISINVGNGIYSILLGDTGVSGMLAFGSLNFDQPLYLQVYVEGAAIGSRVPLAASPYALSVKDGAITNGKIANNAVTLNKLSVGGTAVNGYFLSISGGNLSWSPVSGTFPTPNNPGDNYRYLMANAGGTSWVNLAGSGLTNSGGTISVTYPLPAAFPSLASSQFLTNNGTALLWANIRQVPTGGTSGQYLMTDGSNNLFWTSISGTLPTPNNPSDNYRYLMANAGGTSWVNLAGSGLTNSGGTISVTNPLPAAFPSLASGQFLTNNGTNLSWANLSSTYVDLASAQTISGAKTFSSNVTITTGNSLTIGSANLSFGTITGSVSHSGVNAFLFNTNVRVNGFISASGVIDASNADLAEIYPSAEILAPGDVVVISAARDGYIEKSKTANDTKVAGVISTKPGIVLNSEATGYQLALVGKVPVNVVSEGGNIKRGDLLVASSSPGCAMKAPDNPKPGTIIGKALEDYTGSRGKIAALVNLQ